MPEIANPVRQIHLHLREAGALLTSKNIEGALAAVDAALTIDPASLPAQAMRERIVAVQSRGELPPASTVNHTPPQPDVRRPFIPTGVDAQSWLGFEQRIQERRFNALIEQAQRALAMRDGVAARVALEEARELRPNAREVADLSARAALLPIPAATAASTVGFALAARGLGAVGLLAAGVALLMGIEWMHSAQVTVSSPAPVATAAASVAEPQQLSAPLPTRPIPTSTPTPTPTPTPTQTTRSTQPDAVVSDQPRPVATTGVRRAVNIDGPAVGGPATTTFQTAALVDPPVPASRGEIPDDYVAPQSRRPNSTNDGSAAATPREPVQTPLVIAPPVVIPPAPTPAPPIVAAVAPRTSSPAVLPATAAVPSSRADETRVTQVLTQYARAYGQLDASAARAIWPTVDERALARAFAGLQSQAVSFDGCNVDVRGAIATASCHGRTSYVGKIGNREPRTEQREWTFELRRGSDDAWKIERAKAQRME